MDYDPELPAGFQDADFDLREFEEAVRAARRRAKREAVKAADPIPDPPPAPRPRPGEAGELFGG